jgi:hypothetical protein
MALLCHGWAAGFGDGGWHHDPFGENIYGEEVCSDQGFAVGRPTIGLLPAMGGLLGTLTDRGGSYLCRVKRVGSVGALGGAVGLAVGSAIHGRGWIAVIAPVVLAGVSAVLSSLDDTGSQIGLQLLVYAWLGIGPIGAPRPVWHTAAGFLVGVIWALVLILPGWLPSPARSGTGRGGGGIPGAGRPAHRDRDRRLRRPAGGGDQPDGHGLR